MKNSFMNQLLRKLPYMFRLWAVDWINSLILFLFSIFTLNYICMGMSRLACMNM